MSPRFSASGAEVPKDELIPDQLIGRADVKYVVPSGSEMYDPESRSTEVLITGTATRSGVQPPPLERASLLRLTRGNSRL